MDPPEIISPLSEQLRDWYQSEKNQRYVSREYLFSYVLSCRQFNNVIFRHAITPAWCENTLNAQGVFLNAYSFKPAAMLELCTHINDRHIDDIPTKWVDHIQLLKQVYTRRQSPRAHKWDYLYEELCQFYGVHSQYKPPNFCCVGYLQSAAVESLIRQEHVRRIKQEEDRQATALELKAAALLKRKHEQGEREQKEREKAAKPIAKRQRTKKDKPAMSTATPEPATIPAAHPVCAPSIARVDTPAPALTPYLRAKSLFPRPAHPPSQNNYRRKVQLRYANSTEAEKDRLKSKWRAYQQARKRKFEALPMDEQAAIRAKRAEAYHEGKAKAVAERMATAASVLATTPVVHTTSAPPITLAAIPVPAAAPIVHAEPAIAQTTAMTPVIETASSVSATIPAIQAEPCVVQATTMHPAAQVAVLVPATIPFVQAKPRIARLAALPKQDKYIRRSQLVYRNGSEAVQAQFRAKWREDNARRKSQLEAQPEDKKAAYKSKRVKANKLWRNQWRANASAPDKERERCRQVEAAKRRRIKARTAPARQRDMDLRALERVMAPPTSCGENSARVFSVNSWKTGISLTLAHICNRIAAGVGPKIVAISECFLDVNPTLTSWTFTCTQEYDNGKGSRMARLVVGYDNRALGERVVRSDSTKHTISLFVVEPGSSTPHLQLLFAYLPPRKKGEMAIYRQATMELIAEIDRAEYPLIIMGDLNARMGLVVGDAFGSPRGKMLHKLTKDRGFDILNKQPHTRGVPTYSIKDRKKPAKLEPYSSIVDYGLVQKCIAGSVSGFHLIDTSKDEETHTTTRIRSDHRALEFALALPTSAE
ncbi:hypothetical protein H4R27_005912 [Coemansia aciculifera]|nr:hypothetical protein H4R27_005912 [Coemansia aciculifera]